MCVRLHLMTCAGLLDLPGGQAGVTCSQCVGTVNGRQAGCCVRTGRYLLSAARASGLVTVKVVLTEKGAAWRVKRHEDGVTKLECMPPSLL